MYYKYRKYKYKYNKIKYGGGSLSDNDNDNDNDEDLFPSFNDLDAETTKPHNNISAQSTVVSEKNIIYFREEFDEIITQIKIYVNKILATVPLLQDILKYNEQFKNEKLKAMYVVFKKKCSVEHIHMTLYDKKNNYCFHITNQYYVKNQTPYSKYGMKLLNSTLAFFYKKNYLYFDFLYDRKDNKIFFIIYNSYTNCELDVSCKKISDPQILIDNIDELHYIVEVADDKLPIDRIQYGLKETKSQLNIDSKYGEYEILVCTILISLIFITVIRKYKPESELNITNDFLQFICINRDNLIKFSEMKADIHISNKF